MRKNGKKKALGIALTLLLAALLLVMMSCNKANAGDNSRDDGQTSNSAGDTTGSATAAGDASNSKPPADEAPQTTATSGLVFTFDEDTQTYSVTDYVGESAEVVIPAVYEGKPVTDIDNYAFEDCTDLTSVTIPDSVTSIGGAAFYNCNSLTSVYYRGTANTWASISIGNYNFYPTSATWYYYSKAQPTDTGNYWHYVDGVPTKW